jgi:hypothetical protein
MSDFCVGIEPRFSEDLLIQLSYLKAPDLSLDQDNDCPLFHPVRHHNCSNSTLK